MKNEYIVSVLVEGRDIGTNILANSEEEAMDKADELIREQHPEYETSAIDVVSVMENICNKCGQNFFTHNDDGSCVLDGLTDNEVVLMIKNDLDEHYDDRLDYLSRAEELGLHYNAELDIWLGEIDILGN